MKALNEYPAKPDLTYSNKNKPTLMTFGDTENKVAYGYLAGSNGRSNATPLIAST